MSMDNCTECSELEHLEDGLCLACQESGINQESKVMTSEELKATSLFVIGEQTVEYCGPKDAFSRKGK